MSNPSVAVGVLPERDKKGGMTSVVFAGSVGTIIEWYDFLIYGTAAALVFNTLFFPNVDPLTGTLAALGTYAAGFVARPVGGAIFGHYGDRIGRKTMLMLTMAIMALGTFAVGLLPTYEKIGIWAPILLITLRLIQGVGLGGEWGGASLMVLEHAPPRRRGFFGSLVQIGFPLGLVTSSGVFALVTMMPDADFKTWGWRIPFLLSIVLLAVGWFVRSRVPRLWADDSLLRPLPALMGSETRGILPGGWICRTDLEGREWELHCAGFRNAYAVACDANVGVACSRLGAMYDEARGFGTSWVEAARLYAKACEHGDADGPASGPHRRADAPDARADLPG